VQERFQVASPCSVVHADARWSGRSRGSGFGPCLPPREGGEVEVQVPDYAFEADWHP
jgi:hypothetical protein